jgi:serine/threonine-protein kinase
MTELGPGSRFAGYRLEVLLGGSGRAAVYRAHHVGTGLRVALKVPGAGLAVDPEFRQRFLREASAVARIRHGHIIPVREAGQADGRPFIAMHLVRGGDLRSILSRAGGMPPGRAMSLISPVASALDAIHEAGLVHRNVKPSNVLVDPVPGGPEQVYLSDSGLAMGMDVDAMLGPAADPLGVPAYAAPEQVTAQDADGRADQYALGCIACTVLTGLPPYPREQAIAVLYAHLYDPPPMVTARRGDLPAAVDRVLARALEKNAGDRYESCGALAAALRTALGVPPGPPPDGD